MKKETYRFVFHGNHVGLTQLIGRYLKNCARRLDLQCSTKEALQQSLALMTTPRKSAQPQKPVKPTQPSKEPKLSRTHAPEHLSPIEWQRALRRQFGREQGFGLENLGAEPVFSEFSVSNPQSQSRYRVAIRGLRPGDNFCACPDYASNELGTCKHIEFTLAKLQSQRGAKAAYRGRSSSRFRSAPSR